MACAVFTYRDTCMGCADLYIEVRISYRIPYLLKVPACCKHSKGRNKRNLTAGSKSCRNTCHIALSYTAVYMSVGKCLFENAGLGCSRKIRIQHYKIGKILSAFSKCITIAFSSRDFLYICHIYSPPNSSSIFARSAMAIAYSSSLGALPCQPA